MRKRKHVKRTPGLGGQKNGAEKRFQDQVVAAERRTSGSGGQKNGVEKRFQDQAVNAEKRKKKNETEKRFQDQAVRIRRHMKRRKDGGLVPCDFLLGRWLLGCLGCRLRGGASVWWGWVFGRKPGGHQSLNAKKRCMKRTPGSGGQKNGAEKRFQDQAVKRREQKKDSRIRRSKAGKENITRCTLYILQDVGTFFTV